MDGAESTSGDPTVSTLVAMAEYYIAQTPQKIKEAVRCLMAALSLNPPPRTEAKTRLKLGLLLYHHTNNLLEAREQLYQAALVTQSAANLEEIRFEATSVSTRILVEQRALPQAKSLLRSKLDTSTRHPYWHMRLLLQLADIHVCERDERGVVGVLDRCADYARQVDASYARLLCMLYKGAFLLTHHRYQEAGEVLNQTSSVMEGYHGDKENLIRTFYLIIQVSHLLMAGQVKTAKPHLKQLQQRVKLLSAESSGSGAESSQSSGAAEAEAVEKLTADSIQWLTKEQTFVIVYLVSVMHSVMSGYTDKALTYADKAFQFMNVSQKTDSVGVVSVLRAHLLEHTIVCLLIQGKPASVTDKLEEVVTVCHDHSQLVFSHRAVLHTLLGLYAIATERLDRAISQFHTALQHTNSGDLRVFITINLAISYMKEGDKHRKELAALMKNFDSDLSPTSCLSLKAAVHYVKGLYSYTELKLHDAKRHLRETLVMSNKCDLNKLTACSLILLGQIFLSVGNTKETMDMVSPAMQLAQKIPDRKLQVWAANLLADLYHLTGQSEKEAASREQCVEVERELITDQDVANQSKQSSLLQWTVGDWPVAKPSPSKVIPNDGGGSRQPDISNAQIPNPNMLTQHSSPSTSKKFSSPDHTSSLARPVDYDQPRGAVESMEIDRSHPIAVPTMPTSSSKRRKTSHRKRTPSIGQASLANHDAAVLPQPVNGGSNGGHTTPNGKKQVPLKSLEIKLDNSLIKGGSRRNSTLLATPSPKREEFGVLIKDPEVRLTKVTTPTNKGVPTPPFSLDGQNPNPASKSSNEQGHPLQQADHEQHGMELNSLWMESVSSLQSQDQNFLPSFDSDMAFQQLSLSPSLHRQPRMLHSQQNLATTSQQRQAGFHQDAQRQGHQRESSHSRAPPHPSPPPPSYQQSKSSANPSTTSFRPPFVSPPPSQSNPSSLQYHQPHTNAQQQHQHREEQPRGSLAYQQPSVDQMPRSLSQPQPQKSPSVSLQSQRHDHHSQSQPERERQRGFGRGDLQSSAASSLPSADLHSSSTTNSSSGKFSPNVGLQQSQPSDHQHHQQQMLNDSLSIPTLHDLHGQQQQHLEQQQPPRRTHSPLGIPPFHQIQQQSSSSLEDLSASPSSQIFNSMQLQNPGQLHPGTGGGGSRSPQTGLTGSVRTQQLQGGVGGGGVSPRSHPPVQLSPLQQQRLGTVSQQQQPSQHMGQIRSSISPLHQQQQARKSPQLPPHLPQQQHHSPQSMIQPHAAGHLQGHGLLLHDMQQQQQRHTTISQQQQQQRSSPKRHLQQTLGQQVYGQDSIEDSLLRLTPPQQQQQQSTHTPSQSQFSSSLLQLQSQLHHHQQPHRLSPQKMHPFSSQQSQQARAVLHQQQQQQQQQQQLLQLQQAQAQAQRQFLLQQQQGSAVSGLLQNHTFLPGSGGVQPYFGSAMVNASNKQLMSTHPQLTHPQLTHLSSLQQMSQQDLDRRAVVGAGGALGSLSQQQQQQQVIMGVNPYASLGQGLQLLPNGSTAVPGVNSGFQQQSSSQVMGSPLRHFHSQGR